MAAAPIKAMKLYSGADRLSNILADLGVGPDEPLTVQMLSQFDQLHYHGTEAIDVAIREARIGADDHVLDVGAGWGGPARYLSETSGCRVTAVELQEDMHASGASLTERCGLSDKVIHLRGDILTAPLPSGDFDAAVSWLALYHIEDHAALFSRLHDALRPGGRMHVEDLFGLRDFTDGDRGDLKELYAQCLPSRDAYIADLETAGFTDIDFRDMTDDWRSFTARRLPAFRAERADQVRIHGESVVDGLDAFYAAVTRLFEGGRLGGVRLSAKRK